MSWPWKNTRPPSGVSRPEIRLKNVVLPAPFGPMMACSREPARLKLRLSTAVRPPKRLVKPSVRRMGSLMARSAAWLRRTRRGFLSAALGDARDPVVPQADHALRREDHHQDRDRADDQRVVLPMGRNDLADDDEQRRSDHRAEQRAGAADDRPHHRFAGHVVEHVARRGVAPEEREQRARDAGQEARQHERDQPQQIDVEADQRRAHVVVADGDESLAERARDQAMHQPEAERDGGEDEEILERRSR